MEPTKGVCCLCSKNTYVVKGSVVKDHLDLIPQLLKASQDSNEDFQKITTSVKICIICLYQLNVAVEARAKIKESRARQDKLCRLCHSNSHLTMVTSNWIHINNAFQNPPTDFPFSVCARCIFSLNITEDFRRNLNKRFPNVAMFKRQSNQVDTPKRKSTSKSPISPKKRKIFNDCFTYLQTVHNSGFNVNDKVKADGKLYKRIPYVDITSNMGSRKRRLSQPPVIKIKLNEGSNNKRSSAKKLASQVNESTDTKAKIKPVKKQTSKLPPSRRSPRSTTKENRLSRAKEQSPSVNSQQSTKANSRKTTRTRKSQQGSPRSTDSTVSAIHMKDIEETPKVATGTELAPKRRVSLLIQQSQPTIEEENPEATTEESAGSAFEETAKDLTTEKITPEECTDEEVATKESTTEEVTAKVSTAEQITPSDFNNEEATVNVSDAEGCTVEDTVTLKDSDDEDCTVEDTVTLKDSDDEDSTVQDNTSKTSVIDDSTSKDLVTVIEETSVREVTVENVTVDNRNLEICKIVDKYIKTSTFDDNDKLDLLQEIEKNVECNEKENESETRINSLDNAERQNGDNVIKDACDEENGVLKDTPSDNDEKVNNKENNTATTTQDLLTIDLESESSCSLQGDLNAVSEDKTEESTVKDCLNESSSKKKRVTFSDDLEEKAE